MTENGNGSGPSRAERRAAILAKAGPQHLEEEPATMAGPNGPIDVLVRELTGKQAQAFEVAVARGADAPLGFLLQLSLVDPESHELLFEPADRGALEELGMQTLKPIIDIAQRLSGLTDADVQKAKASLVRAPSIA